MDTKAEDTEAGIIEETVPFAQSKDFFQKLVDGQTTETVVTSEKTVVEKRVIIQQSSSKEGSVEKTSPESQGEVVEEVAPFAERVQFFRRSLEESAIAKDLEKPEWKAKPERPPPPSPVKLSEKASPTRPPPPTVEKSEKEPPQIPPRPLGPSPVEESSKPSLPVAPPRKSKQLPLKTSPDEQAVDEEMSPFTPDLETPKDTPDMASKSAEQKMEMVTERVAEAATSLASTLESVEKRRVSPEHDEKKESKPAEIVEDQPVLIEKIESRPAKILEDQSKPIEKIESKPAEILEDQPEPIEKIESKPAEILEDQPEPIEKIEAKISSILDMVSEQEQQLQAQEEQAEQQIEKLQKEAESDKIWGEVETQVKEAVRDTETMEFELEEEEARLQEPKEVDEESAQDADVSSIGESTGDADEGQAVKAEIKLLVKTMEVGKEAIEIRSIREFVEKDAKPKEDIPKVFSGVMSYPAPEQTTSKSPIDEGQLTTPAEDIVEGKRTYVMQEHSESIVGDARGYGENIHEDKPEEWEIIDDREIDAVKDSNDEDEVKPVETKLSFKEAEAVSPLLTTQPDLPTEPLDDSHLVSDKLLDGSSTLLSEEIVKVVQETSYVMSEIGKDTIETLVKDETAHFDAVQQDTNNDDVALEQIMQTETYRQEYTREVKPSVSFKLQEELREKATGDGVVRVATDIVSEMLVKAQEVVGDEISGSTKTILQVERKMVVDIDTCLERMGLEDTSLSKPSPDDYPAESSATGDYAAAKSLTVDKDVARITPTDESLEDHAQVDKIVTDAGGDSIEKLGRLEIELAEVRTEDEAPEIDEDILTPDTELKSLLGDRGSLGSLSSIDELRQLHSSSAPSESRDAGKQLQISKIDLEEKTPEETVISEQTVTEGAAAWSEITEYFKSEAVRKHADPYDPRSVKLAQQSSLEVEVSSRTSEDLPLSDIVEVRGLQQPTPFGDQQIIEKIEEETKESKVGEVDEQATTAVVSSVKHSEASLDEMGEASPATIAEPPDHLTQADKLPPMDQQVELEKVVPSPTEQSLPQQTIIISDVVSPLSKLSPIEPPSSAVESEISPAVEYPKHLSAQHQVHVGVSPTELLSSKHEPSDSFPDVVPVSASEAAQEKVTTPETSPSPQETRIKSLVSTSSEDLRSKIISETIACETSDRSDTDTTQTETTAIGVVSKIIEEDLATSGRDSQMETTVSDFSDREESFEQDVFIGKPIEVTTTKVQEFRSSVVESSSSMYSSRTESTDSESEVSSCRRSVHMAFENRAFAGVDEIDDSTKIEQPSDVSPFEVPRPDFAEEIRGISTEHFPGHTIEEESDIPDSGEAAQLTKTTTEESEFRKEIFTQEMSDSLEKISPEQKKLYESEKDTPSTIVDIHIKQEMVARELEETEDFSFEEKDLHPSSSGGEQSLDQGEKMAKQIRTDIFTHELDETIDSGSLEEKDILSQSSDAGRKVEQYVAHRMRSDIFSEAMAESPNEQSPEQKDLPVFPHEFDKEDEEEFARHKERVSELQRKEAEAEVVIKSAKEQCPEPVLWEVSVQEQTEVQVRETAQEIPPSKQVIIEKDEDEDREDVTLEELQPKGVFELCHTRVVKKGAAADDEEDQAKIVTSRHPRLEQIPSEISEEDLVERFDASPEKDVEDEPVFLQCTPRTSVDTQADDEKKDHLSQSKTSSMEITDEDLRASSDELSPVEKHTERLESMTAHEMMHKETLQQLQSEQMQQEVAGTLDQKFKEAEMESEELQSTILQHKKEKSALLEEAESIFEEKELKEVTQSEESRVLKIDRETIACEATSKLAASQLTSVEETITEEKEIQKASFTDEVVEASKQVVDHTSTTIEESELVTGDSQKKSTTTSEETLVETSKEASVQEDLIHTKSPEGGVTEKKISRTSSSEESSDTYKVKKIVAESLSSATESESDEMHAELIRSKTQRSSILKTVEESVKKRERISRRIKEEDSSTPDSSGDHKFSDKLPIEGRLAKTVMGDGESYSSSGGESHFYSFETDSGMTSRGTPAASRPCSSDVDALVAGAPGSSEYETCVTSQDGSSTAATSSREYKTAATSLSHSSRESMRSIDSDSSGHLASLEVSSETSETFVPSTTELERDMETPVIDDEKYFASESVREPYEAAIPEPVIRGQEAFMPPDFPLKLEGSKKTFVEVEHRRFGRDGQVKYEELDEPSSPFEVVSESEVADFQDTIPGYEGMVAEAAAADAGKDDIQLKSERPKAYSSDSSGRLTVERSASPDTDGTSTDYHSASEGGPVQLTPQHSGSSLTDYELHHSERLIRATMYRRESGAYMPGEKVDDLSPSREEQAFFPASQGDADAAQNLPPKTSAQQNGSTYYHSQTDTETAASTSQSDEMRVSSHAKSSESTTEAAESSTAITTTMIARSEKTKTVTDTSVYSQANGPVEVDFVPEYDDGDDEHPRRAQRTLPGVLGAQGLEDIVDQPKETAGEGAEGRPQKSQRSRCKEDKDDERKEEDESEDKDKEKDIGDMEESEVLFGEQAFEYPRVVTSTDLAEEKGSDEEMSGAESETEEREEQGRGSESSRQAPASTEYDYEAAIPSAPALAQMPVEPEDESLPHDLEVDRPESELRDLDSSRPQSHAESFYSRSDSDQRPYSELQFSDDRPDSELTELMRQSSDGKEIPVEAEEVERPASPEPKDEYRIQEEIPDVVTETKAMVRELEEDFGVTRTVTGKVVAFEGDDDRPGALVRAEKMEDMSCLAEKHEFETSERSSTEKVELSGDIPDITVTQCPTPTKVKACEFSEASEDQKASREITPSTEGSDKASDSASSQEYVLQQMEEKFVEEKARIDSQSSEPFELVEAPDEQYEIILEEEIHAAKRAGEDLPDVCEVPREPISEERLPDQQTIARMMTSAPEPIPVVSTPPVVKPIDVRYFPEYDGEAEEVFESESPEKGEKETAESYKFMRGVARDPRDWLELQFEGEKVTRAVTGFGYQMEFEKGYVREGEMYMHEEPLEDILEEGEKQDDEEEEKRDKDSNCSSCPKESTRSTPEFDTLAGRKFFSKSGEHDDVSMSSLQEFERLEAEIIRGDRRSSLGSQDSLNGRKIHSRSGQGDDASVSSLTEFEHLEHECVAAEQVEKMAQDEAARLSEIEEGHESQVSESESQETLSEHGHDDDSDVDDYDKRMFEIDEIIRQAQSNVERFEAEKTVDVKTVVTGKIKPTPLRGQLDSGSGGSGDATESSILDKTPSPEVEDEADADSLDGGEVGELDADPPLPPPLDAAIRQATLAQHVLISRTFSSDSSPHRSRGHSSASTTTQYDVESLREREYDLEEGDGTGTRDCGRDSLQGDEEDLDRPGEKGPSCDGDVDSLREDKATGSRDEFDSDSLKGEIGATGHDTSSSGKEYDRDSLGKGGGGGDGMVSSTDSLEPSSSAATHATYQYETDSIMSSSFASVQTSGEDSTMVSSTDTLDPELHPPRSSGVSFLPPTPPHDVRPFLLERDTGRRYIDSEGNLQTEATFRPYVDSEGNVTTGGEDYQNVFPSTVKRTVMMEPEVRTVTFAGPDAERQMRDFIAQFQPGEDVVEMETTDDEGNVHVVRTVQHRVVMPPRATDLQFTGDDAEEKLHELVTRARRELRTTEDEDVEESTDEHGNVRRVIRRRIVQPEVHTMTFSGPDARQQMEEFMRSAIPDFDPSHPVPEAETCDTQGNVTRVVRHSALNGEKGPTVSTVRTTHDTSSAGQTDVTRQAGLHPTPPADPSSPSHSTSSHSEDCYCGPEAGGSALPDPHGARLHSDDGFGQTEHDGTNSTRVVRRHVRTVTTVDADGRESTLVVEEQDEDGEGDGENGGPLRDSMQEILDQFLIDDGERQPPQRDT